MRYVKRSKEKPEAAAALAEAGYPALLASVLAMRGVSDAASAEAFLSPTLDQMHDPFAMAGMERAVAAIRAAVAAKRRIVVFGDYDVDGVTATSVMLSHLRDMGADAGYYLPNRHGEGYGLSEKAVRSLSSAYSMMITVDCGITSIKETALAKELGMEMIVTDHHEPLDTLPDCVCVNPKLGYPFPDLCGAGVAGKLVEALGGRAALAKVIDLVGMGTIADIVPLLDENRVLAAEGLRMVNESMRPGISALAEVSGLLGKTLTSGHISFSIAPRINAGGRIGHSGKSVDMMLATDRAAALETARELDDLNRERQRQEQEILAEAVAQAEQEDLRSVRALVLCGDSWNPGVIGIVASRIVEKYHRPAFVLAREGDCFVGSGRSVPGVHLFQALNALPEGFFARYGGHEMAAGLTIRAERVGEFRRAIQQQLESLEPELFLHTAVYDIDASLSDIGLSLVRSLERLSPTGQANPMPILLMRDLEASCARLIGAEGAHLRFLLSDGKGNSMHATAFRCGGRVEDAQGPVDALVVPEIDTYSGTEQVRMIVRGFERAQCAFAAELESKHDALLCRSLLQIDCAAQKQGFRRHIPLRGEEHLRETLLGMLPQTLGGVLVLCALPQTAARMDEFLRESSCGVMVTRRLDALPDDPSAPHTLCCPMLPSGEALGHYRQILLPDGVWHNALAESLIKAAPDAVLYAPPVSDAVREAVRRVIPSLEEVRTLYRLLRSQAVRVKGLRSFDALCGMLPSPQLAPAAIAVALSMMQEMELICYHQEPFSLSVVEGVQGKRDLTATPTYHFFHAFCGDEKQEA